MFNFINLIFPKKVNISKKQITKLLENRNFYFKKEKTISFLPYQNKLIKNLFYNFKFKKQPKIAKIFSEILFENLPEVLEYLYIQENFSDPVLIPIPISFLRKISRSYNQNNLILKEFQKLGGNKFVKIEKNILFKIKHTKPQTKMKNKKERKENIKNSFFLFNAKKLKNKNIIIFDDIKTTGSTLIEAERILKKVKPKKILFLTIAQ